MALNSRKPQMRVSEIQIIALPTPNPNYCAGIWSAVSQVSLMTLPPSCSVLPANTLSRRKAILTSPSLTEPAGCLERHMLPGLPWQPKMPAVTWQPVDNARMQRGAITNSITPPAAYGSHRTTAWVLRGASTSRHSANDGQGGWAGWFLHAAYHAHLPDPQVLSSGFHRYNFSDHHLKLTSGAHCLKFSFMGK